MPSGAELSSSAAITGWGLDFDCLCDFKIPLDSHAAVENRYIRYSV